MVAMSDARWSADARFIRAGNRERISTAKRNSVRDKLAALIPGGVGKDRKYRYMSDFEFKTEAKCREFWEPKIAAANLTDVVEIGPHYWMAF